MGNIDNNNDGNGDEPLSFEIHNFGQLPSTQDQAKEMIDNCIAESDESAQYNLNGHVIQTMMQSGGRGRNNRQWDGPMGNLYMSVILSPQVDMRHAGQLGFVAALAIVELVKTLIGEGTDIDVKWPNDVLVKGKKISGILIEKHHDMYILGIGLNILAPPEGAAGLQEISDKRLPINPVRDLLLDIFAGLYLSLQYGGFAPIKDKWMANAAFLDQDISVEIASGKIVQGILKGIDDNGALLLHNEDGLPLDPILSGDIFFD